MLNILNEWQKKWLLSFNTADNKCKVLSITSAREKRDNITNYYLNDSLLPNHRSGCAMTLLVATALLARELPIAFTFVLINNVKNQISAEINHLS